MPFHSLRKCSPEHLSLKRATPLSLGLLLLYVIAAST